MADTVIGALRVALGLDTASFEENLNRSAKSVDTFGKKVTAIAAGIGLEKFAERAADSLSHLVKGSIEAADQMGKMAQKTGVAVEPLSGLKFAAELADVSFESLGKGLAKLSKAILEGAVNPSGEAGKSFQALGVSVRDATGQIKPTDQIFSAIAERFSNMRDGSEKTALAIRLFGRAGADLIPLLNLGADGIKKMTDEARELGVIISTETAAKAEEFNDTLKRISTVSQGIGLRIAGELLPALQRLADAMLDAGKNGSALEGFLSKLVTPEDINNLLRVGQLWENLGRTLVSVRQALSLVFKGEFTAALATLNEALEDNARRWGELEQKITAATGAFNVARLMEMIKGLEGMKFGLGGVDTGALHAKDSLEKFLDTQKKSNENTLLQAQYLGGAVGAFERAKFVTDAYLVATQNGITVTGEMAAKISEMGIKSQEAAVALAGAQMKQENLDINEKYAQQLERINQLLAEEAITAQTAARATQKAQIDLAEAWLGSLKNLSDGLAQFTGALGKNNKEMFRMSQAFAIASAVINVALGITKALSLPFPLNWIQSAAVAAAGLAQIVTIKSQKYTGAAFGGKFKVPGGSMGVDTKMVQMALAPGELIDVTPASKATETANGYLELSPINSRDFFTGDMVREMVLAIDQWVRDGGTGVRFVTR